MRFGVVVGDSPFAPTNNAEAMAARLASTGTEAQFMTRGERGEPKKPEPAKSEAAAAKSDLEELRAQLTEMRRRLDSLSDKPQG